MVLKDFVYLHKKEFFKSAKDIVNYNPNFVKECIEKYQCPDVFEELKTGNKLRQTKFFEWWHNRNKYIKKANIEGSESFEVKKTTKEVVKKKIIKAIQTESKECIVFKKRPINQTVEITRIYHRLDFQTPLAKKTINEVEKELNILVALRKNTITTNAKVNKEVQDIIDNAIERYKQELEDTNFCYEKEIKQIKEEIQSFIATGTLLDKTSDEYKRYEELKDTYNSKVNNFYKHSAKRDENILNRIKTTYDIREKQSNEYTRLIEALVKIQMAIKATIENEKQIFENNLYEKTQENEAKEDDLKKAVAEIAKQIENGEIKDVN